MAYPIDVPYVIATHVRKYLSSSRLIAKARAGALGMVNGILYFNNGTTVAPIGGTGVAPLRQATVTLTNDQIIHLPSTGIEIVPAPGTNKALILVSGRVILDATHGAYTNLTAGGFVQILVGTSDASNYVLTDFFGQTGTVQIESFTPTTYWDETAGINKDLQAGDEVVNAALNLGPAFNTGNFTVGHTLNTLRVSITYLILNITTGLFE